MATSIRAPVMAGVAARVLIAAGVLFATGCGRLERLSADAVPAPSEPPRIAKLRDLGLTDLPPGKRVPLKGGDDCLVPGELVAVEGRGLGAGTALTIDGRPLTIVAHLVGGGVVARLPRGLTPGPARTLRATTTLGKTETTCAVHGWVIVADSDGDQLRFVRLTGESDKAPFADGSAPGLGLTSVRAIAVAPDGARCYAIQGRAVKDALLGRSTNTIALVTVDMVAPEEPRQISSRDLDLPSPPERLAALPGGRLAVLCRRHLVLVDPATEVGVIATTELPGGDGACYAALALLRGGARLMALDVIGNRVVAIDLDPEPRIAAEVALLPDTKLPWSVTVVADPAGEDAWAVLGPNHRTIVERMGFGEPGGVTPTIPRVVRLSAAEGSLTVSPLAELSADFLPIHASFADGIIWVSGVASMSERLRGLERNLEGLRKAVTLVASTARLGQLMRVDAESGSVVTALRGMVVYTTTAGLADGRPVCAILRLRPHVFPPSIGVDYGIECAGEGFVRLRELSWWTVVPPYGLGELAVQ